MTETYVEKRPWGKFEKFTSNENTTVKLLYINTGQRLSYQYHNDRSEFWKLVRGKVKVTIDDKDKILYEGDSIEVPKRAKHRIEGLEPSVLLEIAYGQFNENDIVRIQDDYNRGAKMLNIGLLGKGMKLGNSFAAMAVEEEPVLTIDTIINTLGLKNKMASVKVEKEFMIKSDSANSQKEIDSIWKELIAKKQKWIAIRPKILKLKELGNSILPLIFHMSYPGVEIEIICSEDTIGVCAKDIDLGKLEKKLRKTEHDRLPVMGGFEGPSIKITST